MRSQPPLLPLEVQDLFPALAFVGLQPQASGAPLSLAGRLEPVSSRHQELSRFDRQFGMRRKSGKSDKRTQPSGKLSFRGLGYLVHTQRSPITQAIPVSLGAEVSETLLPCSCRLLGPRSDASAEHSRGSTNTPPGGMRFIGKLVGERELFSNQPHAFASFSALYTAKCTTTTAYPIKRAIGYAPRKVSHQET